MSDLDDLRKDQERQERELRQHFDPDDPNSWQNMSSEEFVANLAYELIAATEAIETWTKILNEKPEMRSINWTVGERVIPATYWLEGIMGRTKILYILISALKVHGQQVFKSNDQ